MIRRVPFGLVAIKDARRRARSCGARSLQLESLEARHTFCTDLAELAAISAPAPSLAQAEGEQIASPFYGPMPVAYYAQFPELPAAIPIAEAPASNPALVDAALESMAPTSQGEGEGGTIYNGTYSVSRGKAPRIVEFGFEPSHFGGIIVFGNVLDEDGPVSSLSVKFYGALAGRSSITESDGRFSLYIPRNEIPRGIAEADVTDLNGNKSDRVSRLF